MIRAEFGIDPYTLSDEEFLDRWVEAAWLQQHRTRMIAGALGLLKEDK